MPCQLIAETLTISRGTRTIIKDLSFAVDAGSALVLTGPNGAGKTTLLRVIAGLIKPDRGQVHLTGSDDIVVDATLGECCHYVGHLAAVKARMTVGENLAFWARYLGGVEPRVDRAVEVLGLTHLRDVPAGLLSAGQRRRVGLGRLLVADRPVWLLDEPTTALDAASQDVVKGLIIAHLGKGGLAIMSSHAVEPPGDATLLHLSGVPGPDALPGSEP